MLHHQLLEQEREQLMAELQERTALSGALEPLLSENDTAAGRLWDMSKGQLQRGDYQRLVEYGNFAAAAGAEKAGAAAGPQLSGQGCAATGRAARTVQGHGAGAGHAAGRSERHSSKR